eukprot:221345-Amphidinium_carterae.2
MVRTAVPLGQLPLSQPPQPVQDRTESQKDKLEKVEELDDFVWDWKSWCGIAVDWWRKHHNQDLLRRDGQRGHKTAEQFWLQAFWHSDQIVSICQAFEITGKLPGYCLRSPPSYQASYQATCLCLRRSDHRQVIKLLS